MSSSLPLLSLEARNRRWRSAGCSLQKENDCITRKPRVPLFASSRVHPGAARDPSGLGSRGCWSAREPSMSPPGPPPDIPPWEFRCDQRLSQAWPGRALVQPRRIQNVLSSFPLLCHHARHSGISDFFPPDHNEQRKWVTSHPGESSPQPTTVTPVTVLRPAERAPRKAHAINHCRPNNLDSEPLLRLN